MKVSIITVCYNSANTIESTIKSVIEQSYPEIEYILIDGLSKDGTLGIIEKYRNSIAKVISEKDSGIYDAINKGIDVATGDVIGILNSDDFYINNTVIADVVDALLNSNADSCYADLQYIDRLNINKIIRNWKSKNYYEGIFYTGWMPPHPTFFVKKACYEKYGKFNLKLKSAADYELMLRFLHKHHVSTTYLPKVLVKMRVGGMSNKTLMNRIAANREDRLAWKINGLKPGMFTLLFKPLSKIKQFLG
ncbi:MAG: glycosyltransferase [Bacteroidetes bacterium]|nr:glycosyltransferase [Bacteroidota bacterium]